MQMLMIVWPSRAGNGITRVVDHEALELGPEAAVRPRQNGRSPLRNVVAAVALAGEV
jgi:hypothetical protein